MATMIYTLFGSVKYDPYDDHVVGMFSTVEKALQRAQALVGDDEYDAFRIMQHELDGLAEAQLIKTMHVGSMYHVQVIHQDHRIIPVTVVVRAWEDGVSKAKQWVVDHFAEQGVRVFKKHMEVSQAQPGAEPVLIYS